MKNAVIFHGTDENPDSYWYQWLACQLRARGYRADVPFYPAINQEKLADFLPQVLANHEFNSETVLIGHSAGAPLILSILERINVEIAQAVLVAGYSQRRANAKNMDPILQENYNWDRIRGHVKDIYFVNSVVDPWGCDDKQGRIMFDQLGGTHIVRDEGHFGSTSNNQPYPTFELLIRLIS
ncbi:MAG: alpha/beta hydrolase [Corynebacteriales bacterium]|nr:alpha/beta hydrolase [Mycobacteriales bacterium]